MLVASREAISEKYFHVFKKETQTWFQRNINQCDRPSGAVPRITDSSSPLKEPRKQKDKKKKIKSRLKKYLTLYITDCFVAPLLAMTFILFS
jgi:hypothetical protein